MPRPLLPLLLFAACTSLPPPTPALLAILAGQPPPPLGVRESAVVRIASDFLSGTFDARLVARTTGGFRVRLQLFPDVGGKILDLAAGPDGIRGVMPPADLRFRVDLPATGTIERHFLFWFGVTLLEHFTPVTPGRVVGARPVPEGHELLLAPVVPGVEVIAIVDGEGRVHARRYCHRWVRWAEDVDARTVTAPGFQLSIERREQTPAPELPDALFELALPEEPR